MTTTARRTRPIVHLDAHLATLEKALLARADALDAEATTETGRSALSAVLCTVAAEYRTLAEELHYQ